MGKGQKAKRAEKTISLQEFTGKVQSDEQASLPSAPREDTGCVSLRRRTAPGVRLPAPARSA